MPHMPDAGQNSVVGECFKHDITAVEIDKHTAGAEAVA